MRKIKEEKLIGEISHYYKKISVAVLKLSCCLGIGDSIRIMGGRRTDFYQRVNSIEINHERIPVAEAGETIGIMVKEPVREGYRVYKV